MSKYTPANTSPCEICLFLLVVRVRVEILGSIMIRTD
jgi:hypothetical protein